jgi:hypothetical protein
MKTPALKIITMTASHRPQYTCQVLEALARCRGIQDYLLMPSLEPGHDDVRSLFEAVSFAECRPVVHRERLGCAANTLFALERGFRLSDFVIHIEDDTVPAADALEFFEHCREAYRQDPQVFTIGGYPSYPGAGKLSGAAPAGGSRALARHPWFTPWGWATWLDRFVEMARDWSLESWDTHLNHVVRGRRCEITPTLSRFQNIGAEQGVHVPSAEWHRANQHLDFWAGMIEIPSEANWSEPPTGRSEAAGPNTLKDATA